MADKAPAQGKYPPSYIMALVCDIRGFTDLTARVDEYVQSVLNPEATCKQLVKHYTLYMIETQRLARAKIIDPLLRQYKNLSYAVKSTGDGYLVAIELGAIYYHVPRSGFDDNWLQKALRLTKGLVELVKEAEPKAGGGEFGILTYEFLKRWSEEIGVDMDWINSKSPRFDATQSRVAGALAMGTGFLSGRAMKDEAKDKPNLRYADAFGHSVNMAFRLCNAAGRRREERQGGRDVSPFILIDRRVARLLLAAEKRYDSELEQELRGYGLIPYKDPIGLKGIEENWCYALD